MMGRILSWIKKSEARRFPLSATVFPCHGPRLTAMSSSSTGLTSRVSDIQASLPTFWPAHASQGNSYKHRTLLLHQPRNRVLDVNGCEDSNDVLSD